MNVVYVHNSVGIEQICVSVFVFADPPPAIGGNTCTAAGQSSDIVEEGAMYAPDFHVAVDRCQSNAGRFEHDLEGGKSFVFRDTAGGGPTVGKFRMQSVVVHEPVTCACEQ